MKVRILPYKKGSKSAKALSQELGGLRIKENGNFRHAKNHLVINWGCNNVRLVDAKVNPMYKSLNCAKTFDGELLVYKATNKLDAFKIWKEVIPDNIPAFTENHEEAQDWVDDGKVVVVRELLRGSGGRGIGLVGKEIEDGDHTGMIPRNKPLYVQYVKKQDEYRVHIFCGEVIDIQRKMRKLDVPDEQVNWKIRNHENGFIFGREGVGLPDKVLNDVCVKAMDAIGLDFGAIDIIHNRHSDTWYVLEVNTAPGLEGSTLDHYREAVRGLL